MFITLKDRNRRVYDIIKFGKKLIKFVDSFLFLPLSVSYSPVDRILPTIQILSCERAFICVRVTRRR